jgi:predicted metal-dependent HD superfamily phosphohydrolase
VGALPPQDLLERLLAAWSEPWRHYHTLQHLSECLDHAALLAPLAAYPAEVALALWFHDAVYERGRHDNEARSADWAREAMRTAGLPEASAERVAALIMATCHQAEPAGGDAVIVVDIDLWILGAPAERFDEYEGQVRREYGHLPDAAFRQGRAAVLRQFLGREWIFGTPLFRERFETPARENLERSLRALGAGGDA